MRIFKCSHSCDGEPCFVHVSTEDAVTPDYCPYMGSDCVFEEVVQ